MDNELFLAGPEFKTEMVRLGEGISAYCSPNDKTLSALLGIAVVHLKKEGMKKEHLVQLASIMYDSMTIMDPLIKV